MRKYIFTSVIMAILAIMIPVAANAQSYVRRYVDSNGRVHYVQVKKPSFYRRHRDVSNVAMGTGGGALLGAIIGGKKGAGIGALAGAGGSALYTYKIKPNKRKYYKVRNY